MMSFSRIFRKKAANNDRMRLDREIQHTFVRCERARLQNE